MIRKMSTIQTFRRVFALVSVAVILAPTSLPSQDLTLIPSLFEEPLEPVVALTHESANVYEKRARFVRINFLPLGGAGTKLRLNLFPDADFVMPDSAWPFFSEQMARPGSGDVLLQFSNPRTYYQLNGVLYPVGRDITQSEPADFANSLQTSFPFVGSYR